MFLAEDAEGRPFCIHTPTLLLNNSSAHTAIQERRQGEQERKSSPFLNVDLSACSHVGPTPSPPGVKQHGGAVITKLLTPLILPGLGLLSPGC